MRAMIVLGVAFLASPLAAQQLEAPATTQPPPAAEMGDIAAAKAALERMSGKLQALSTFEIVSESTSEEVFADEEKLQFLNRVRYVVGGPDRFYASVRSDRQWRRYYYDGSGVTIVAPRSGYYATAPLTGSTVSILNSLVEDYGIEMPLIDLFLWQSREETMPEIKDAFLVGFAQIDEHPTDQWFYRVDGADVQLWIGRNDALPHRLVITNTDDVAQPQYVASITWNLEPEIGGSRFTFIPSETNTPIPITPKNRQLVNSQGE